MKKGAAPKPERTLLTLLDEGYDADAPTPAQPIYLPGDKVIRITAYGGYPIGPGLGEIGTVTHPSLDGISIWVKNAKNEASCWHLDKIKHAPKPTPLVCVNCDRPLDLDSFDIYRGVKYHQEQAGYWSCPKPTTNWGGHIAAVIYPPTSDYSGLDAFLKKYGPDMKDITGTV